MWEPISPIILALMIRQVGCSLSGAVLVTMVSVILFRVDLIAVAWIGYGLSKQS